MGGTNEKGRLAIICQQDSLLLPNISQGDISLDEGSLCIEFLTPTIPRIDGSRSTAVAALIWLAKMAETGAHWILQECSHLFPSEGYVRLHLPCGAKLAHIHAAGFFCGC